MSQLGLPQQTEAKGLRDVFFSFRTTILTPVT